MLISLFLDISHIIHHLFHCIRLNLTIKMSLCDRDDHKCELFHKITNHLHNFNTESRDLRTFRRYKKPNFILKCLKKWKQPFINILTQFVRLYSFPLYTYEKKREKNNMIQKKKKVWIKKLYSFITVLLRLNIIYDFKI